MMKLNSATWDCGLHQMEDFIKTKAFELIVLEK